MADKHDVVFLPIKVGSSLTISDNSNTLAARGLKDIPGLNVRQAEPRTLARVGLIRSPTSFEGGKHTHRIVHYGLIEISGEFVVEPKYHWIEPFSSGLAAFSVRSTLGRYSTGDAREEMFNSDPGFWGYLDCSGTVKIAPRFEQARNFIEGLAAVRVGTKWGFICHDGSFAIEPVFDGAQDFNNGLAIVRLGRKCGFIDRSGEFIIDPRFDYLWQFSEGLACADIGGRCGYINANGAFAIEPKFVSSGTTYPDLVNFRRGVAILEDNERLTCVIDSSGDTIFKCEDVGQSINPFADGIARVFEVGGYCDHAYFIDISGKRVLSEYKGDDYYSLAESVDAAGDFSDGIGMVVGTYRYYHNGDLMGNPQHRYADRERSARLYGYIDAGGNLTIPPRFHLALPFKNGTAGVDPVGDDQYGFIDASGKMIIEPMFSRVRDFSEGMVAIQRSSTDRKWGFSNHTGENVISCRFDVCYDFQRVMP